MGVIESSLCSGPVYLICFPNLSLSLKERNNLDAIKMNLETIGYNYKPGSEHINIVYRIYYKVKNNITPDAKLISTKGKTTLIETNLAKSNVVVPGIIAWNGIQFPESWTLQAITQP